VVLKDKRRFRQLDCHFVTGVADIIRVLEKLGQDVCGVVESPIDDRLETTELPTLSLGHMIDIRTLRTPYFLENPASLRWRRRPK
jgi:hypothetical protein